MAGHAFEAEGHVRGRVVEVADGGDGVSQLAGWMVDEEITARRVIGRQPSDTGHCPGVAVLRAFPGRADNIVGRGAGVIPVKQVLMAGNGQAVFLGWTENGNAGMVMGRHIPFISLHNEPVRKCCPDPGHDRKGIVPQRLPAPHRAHRRGAEQDGVNRPRQSLGVAAECPAMLRVGDPVQAELKTMAKDFIRGMAAVGEHGMVVKITRQPASGVRLVVLRPAAGRGGQQGAGHGRYFHHIDRGFYHQGLSLLHSRQGAEKT